MVGCGEEVEAGTSVIPGELRCCCCMLSDMAWHAKAVYREATPLDGLLRLGGWEDASLLLPPP